MSKARGNVRWALRNVTRTHRELMSAQIAYVRAWNPNHAALMLPRVTAAEIRHAAARDRLRALQDARDRCRAA